jgi:hypothetical protein
MEMSFTAEPTVSSPIGNPVFRDPVFDGATDPTLIWNRQEQSWWMVYTSRRAFGPPLPDVSWIHGSSLGVASSVDGTDWTYRGVLTGLDTSWGTWTYWAPEILDDGTSYHMFVSTIRGMPTHWNLEREIRHYVSDDLTNWTFHSTVPLSSNRVIDACVIAKPGGGYRMWYKDEVAGSHTWYADSDDLETWAVVGEAIAGVGHEGPNVFAFAGAYWMVTDEWRGLRLHRSPDLTNWTRQGLILTGGSPVPDQSTMGRHGDVVVSDLGAYIFYFTHPGKSEPEDGFDYDNRRSSIHVAKLHAVGETLTCDPGEPLTAPVLPRLV